MTAAFLMEGGGENKVGELGYMILTPWWSKGIGTEAVRQMCGIACEELGLERISATVFEGNRASERVLEKNGFRLEEVLISQGAGFIRCNRRATRRNRR